MKKKIYLLIGLLLLALTGCGKKAQMVDFIPTPIPTEEASVDTGEDTSTDIEEETTDDTSTDTEEEVSDTPIVVGKTTTKYVKMKAYNDFLNVRSSPSMEGDIVGFLVHTEKIEVIKIEDDWACFVMNDEYRYVSADYLVDVRPDYIDPPTPTPSPIPTIAPTHKPTKPPTHTPAPTPDPTTPPEI